MSIIRRDKVTTSISKTFRDLTNDQTKHYFAKDNVYFALKLTGPTPEKLLDPTYFTFAILQSSFIKDTSPAGYHTSSTPIEYEYWGSKFSNLNQNIYNRLGLSTYLWPKNTDFFVRANYYYFQTLIVFRLSQPNSQKLKFRLHLLIFGYISIIFYICLVIVKNQAKRKNKINHL